MKWLVLMLNSFGWALLIYLVSSNIYFLRKIVSIEKTVIRIERAMELQTGEPLEYHHEVKK